MTFTDNHLAPGTPRPVLLATKLHAPALRAVRVHRQRLLDRMEAGTALPLTLVSAPAGFGKSTLIGDWLSRSARPSTWYSLDAGDRDLRRFVRYFLAALDRPLPGVGRSLSGLLAAADLPEDPEVLLGPLLNELWERPACVAVLDDYHLLESPPVDAALSFLVERLPDSLRLVMATRTDPDLPLPRLRARGLLGEIRTEDLRFTAEEAALFLREAMGLTLSAAQIEAMEQKTEGWIAGLQLAALSLRGRDDVGAALASFTGSHRFILDYLTEEVLERQPPERLDFLLETSILPRLSAPLCDAVTGRGDGREQLAALDAANLFLIPLDDTRTWYRYHHLFAGLLGESLRRRLGEGGLAPLQERACDWFVTHGLVEEAMDQALAAGDEDRAARILLDYAGTALNRGDLGLLDRWFGSLSEGCFERHPLLSIPQGFVLFASFRFPEIAAVEARLARAAAAGGNVDLAAGLDALRALLLTGRGEHEGIVAFADKAREGSALDRFSLRSLLSVVLGISLARLGQYARAFTVLDEGVELALASGNLTLAVVARACQASVDALHGRLRQSAERCRQAIALFLPWGEAQLPAAGSAHCGLAEVFLELGDLDAALEAITTSTRLTYQGKVIGHHVRGLSLAVRIHLAREEFATAREIFTEVAALIRRTQVPIWLAATEALEARIDLVQGLRQGDPELVGRAALWLERLGRAALIEKPEEHLIPDVPRDCIVLTAAHLLVKTGRLEEASRLLPALAEMVIREDWVRSRIEVALLEALLLARREADADTPERIAGKLAEALGLAEPEGFLQVFVDEAAELLPLLATVERHRPEALATPFAHRLQQALRTRAGLDKPAPTPTAPAPSAAPAAAGEEISERELEILRLIATGLSNAEAARKLYLSPHTVKKHLENIYGKLGVKNRTEAIAKLQAGGRFESPRR